MRALSCASAVTAILLAGLSTVLALTSAPVPPNPQASRSEGTGPQDPRSTGSTNGSDENLSERLNRSDGVIRPPTDSASDMAIRPPDPGTTRVIPPPSTPGGDQSIEPK
jgi:hypothetical protein